MGGAPAMSEQRAILDAAFWGDLQTVQGLLERDPSLVRTTSGGDPYEAGATALHLAACAGHLSVARVLVAAGAAVNAIARDGTPLAMAAWEGHEELVRLLLEQGADPRIGAANGETALHLAAYKGNIAI